MKQKFWIIPAFVLLVFSLLSFLTVKDYGWNWDSFLHFTRGQAYYHYFSTGKLSNESSTPFNDRISLYETIPFDFGYASRGTFGHPPATDIILASINQFFYKKLGFIGDLETYHIYGIFLTSIAGLVILLWSYEICGWIGAFISLLVYWMFPLLFAEQHFNIKDPAIAAYNIIFLYCIWIGVTKNKYLFFLFSAIIGGLSMGTKFNILFLFPPLIIWFVWITKGNIIHWMRHQSFHFLIALAIVPCIMFFIFYGAYVELWSHPLENIQSVILFYKNVGGTRCPFIPTTGLWFIRCSDWNTFRMFIVTVPIPSIILAIVGSVVALKSFSVQGMAPFLWFITVFMIIIRVILPITSLYGGTLRQIMEFIGPFALLSGFGAAWISKHYKKTYIVLTCILLCFVFVIYKMILLHPNENLYTNVLIDIFWRDQKQQFINGTVTYGNAYKQGTDWINMHAESGSMVAPVMSVGPSIPEFIFRQDISYSPKHWSSYEQRGEYLFELVDAGSHSTQFFPYKYVTNILQPVYEKMVEGYPIVRVWKNDQAHVRTEFLQPVYMTLNELLPEEDEIVLRLQTSKKLQSLQIITKDVVCRNQIMNSYILVSEDGKEYKRMYETIQEMNKTDELIIYYPFAGESAQFIKIFSYIPIKCDWLSNQYAVQVFQ